ncbi:MULTISPECIES: Tol-Pal system beta propeller repeat protein TolB [Microbulbifer]|uniref:Tol-Pal system beta propeller repeat protein TolB n=1 Tax=Microbulbifer TaxID=48073 RepID=UPI001E532374|nr:MULTISPECIES: Tol-Pal system beta propeller repeat protein TolB [Microbulbifer]UHQ54680.1 Tol-Pal system beta propeller repeat protein TolB [Microbulbifer sp. YPW16]
MIKNLFKLVAVLVVASLSLSARAQLVVDITSGIDDPTPIAVAPFSFSGTGVLSEDVSDIISADLRRSGLFAPVPKEDMLSFPKAPDEVIFRDWRILGTEYVVTGRIEPQASGYLLTFDLVNIFGQQTMFTKQVSGGSRQLRDIAHRAADEIYEAITGIRGAFSTEMIYVQEERRGGRPSYSLVRSDIDGARPKVIRRFSEPVMSPMWSPDGQEVAYVSFETGRPAIFRENLRTGARQQLTNFKGINSSPTWSPDGSKLAMVLSKDGNPEIYVLDLRSGKFTRMTRHFSIDTEPNWMPDGKSLVFTSDRGGKPQIYQLTLATGQVDRLTFDGDYNARPRVSPDGKTLVMVHRSRGVFTIATMDIVSGRMRVLTETRLDESPSIAPNGAMLMYATKRGDKGILAAVSLDAGVKYRLPSRSGDVREPAWSPYFD